MGPKSLHRLALLCMDPLEKPGDSIPSLAARRLLAAVQATPTLAGWDARLFEARGRDPAPWLDFLQSLDPDVVGASAYVWSFPTFLQVAREWKRRRPDGLFVMGGPSARPVLFTLTPYRDGPSVVDVLVQGEGEEVLPGLLEVMAADRGDLGRVPGLDLSDGRAFTPTAPRTARLTPGHFPSPYQEGLFPPGQTALLETFRGCSRGCTFCQNGLDAELRLYPKDYLVRELLAFRELRSPRVIFISSGLNMQEQAFRNLAEAERETGVLRERVLAVDFYPSHLSRAHLEFVRDAGACSVGFGVQSFQPEVVRSLHRSVDEARLERMVRALAEVVPSVSIDLMLGLPGDAPAAFMESLQRIDDWPCSVRVSHSLALPGALLDRPPPGADLRIDEATLKVVSCRGWTPDDLARSRDEMTRHARRRNGTALGDLWEFPTSGKERLDRDRWGGRVPPAAAEALHPGLSFHDDRRVPGTSSRPSVRVSDRKFGGPRSGGTPIVSASRG
jgi:hypothetical protein